MAIDKTKFFTMDKRKIVIPLVLTIFLAGLGAWGITQYLEKNRLLLQAENQYDRSFNSLLWHTGNVQTEITKALASNSPDQLMKLTANIWRESFSAKQNLAQLPLTFLQLNKTERFLNQINEFSFFLSQQATERKTLNDQEWETLRQFHAQITEVNQELQRIGSQAVARDFRWNQLARQAAVNIDGLPSNIMTTGFLNIDQQMQKRPDLVYEGSTLDFRPEVRAVTGEEITQEEAIAKAREALPQILRGRQLRVLSENRGHIPAYTIEATAVTGGNPVYLDVTKRGGHVLWFFTDRRVPTKNLSLKEAEEIAAEFITEMNFENMVVVSGEINQNMATISLVFEKDDILRYTDMVRVKVALDNGEILGYDARNYFTFHCPDPLPEPELSPEDAKAKVNDRLDIKRQRLVTILNDTFEEVLAYEFFAKLGEENVYVYINAMTGVEERIERRIVAPSEELVL